MDSHLDDRLSNPLFIFVAMPMIHSASMVRPFVPLLHSFIHASDLEKASCPSKVWRKSPSEAGGGVMGDEWRKNPNGVFI